MAQLLWRVCSYNACSCVQPGRLLDITRELATEHIIALQGTRLHHDQPVLHFRDDKFIRYSWGAGKGAFSNKNCGVEILLRRSRFQPRHVKKIWSAPTCKEELAPCVSKAACSTLPSSQCMPPPEPQSDKA
eukprot:95834-Amphidinium_carterae.1